MAEPSTQFWERVLTPEVRQAGAVGASLQMIALLPEEKEKARTSVVEVACLEAWFVHMRLLIEYFGLKNGPASAKDFSATDMAWKPTPDRELAELWQVASQHVVHFSLVRTPTLVKDVDPFDTSRQNLERLASTGSGRPDTGTAVRCSSAFGHVARCLGTKRLVSVPVLRCRQSRRRGRRARTSRDEMAQCHSAGHLTVTRQLMSSRIASDATTCE